MLNSIPNHGENEKTPLPRPLSKVLQDMADEATAPVTVRTITNIVADRSLGGLLAFFSALNLIPLPPGTSAVTGIPIVFIAIQLLFMHRSVWLPKFIAERELSPERLKSIMDKLVPWARWIEKYLRPRYWPFGKSLSDRLIGAISLILGLCVVFPIPLGNAAPAFASFLLGMALSERDGLWLGAGIISGILSLLWISTLVGGAYLAATSFFHLGG